MNNGLDLSIISIIMPILAAIIILVIAVLIIMVFCKFKKAQSQSIHSFEKLVQALIGDHKIFKSEFETIRGTLHSMTKIMHPSKAAILGIAITLIMTLTACDNGHNSPNNTLPNIGVSI